MRRFLVLFVLTLLTVHLQAQRIEHFSYSQCGGNQDSLTVSSVPKGAERIYDRIISQKYANNILKLRFGKLSNCAGISNPKSFFSGDTLKITFDDFVPRIDTLEDGSIVEVHEIVMCDCYFESDYVISDLPKEPLIILVNGTEIKHHPKYKSYPVTFEVLDGDTINYTDEYGLEQGKWIERNSKGQLLFKGIKKDDSVVEGTSYRYHDNGNIEAKLEWVNYEYSNFYRYDPDGNLISHTKSPFDD